MALAVTTYEWVKAFHVLAAVIWVGGAVVIQILALFALRSKLPRPSLPGARARADPAADRRGQLRRGGRGAALRRPARLLRPASLHRAARGGGACGPARRGGGGGG